MTDRLEKIRKRQGVSYSGDKEFLIGLVDEQQAKLDAIARLPGKWLEDGWHDALAAAPVVAAHAADLEHSIAKTKQDKKQRAAESVQQAKLDTIAELAKRWRRKAARRTVDSAAFGACATELEMILDG